MVGHRPEGVRYARVTERPGPSRWMWSDLGNARHRWALPTTSLRSALPGDTWLESFDADYEAGIGDCAIEIVAALQRLGDETAESHEVAN